MVTMLRVTTAVGLAALISSALAVDLQKRTDGPPRVVAFPIERRQVQDPVQRDRVRRSTATVQTSLDNEETLYFANGTLGTPAQSFRLHIDTGSSDLWVNTASSELCSERSKPCDAAGTYAANDSSTYAYVNSIFNITYVDGSGAAGDYVTDTFTIGGATVKSQQFGIGYNSSASEGILGIGYMNNEAQVQQDGDTYKNVPANMLSQGLIHANAFSLWLNDLDSSTGSILFGGVDTEKYHGELLSLPVQQVAGNYYEFLITLTALSLGHQTLTTDQKIAVLLDSGSSLTYLPDTITEAIYDAVDAQYDSSDGVAYVACSLASNTSSLIYTFDAPNITVTMDELVIPLTSATGKPVTFTDGTPACLFGIAPAGGSTPVLGDTFLRSAYVVYDLSNNEIALAQTNFNATASNVVEIASSSSGVPGASDVANAPTATSGADASSVTGSTVGLVTSSSVAEPTAQPGAAALLMLGAGMVYAAM